MRRSLILFFFAMTMGPLAFAADDAGVRAFLAQKNFDFKWVANDGHTEMIAPQIQYSGPGQLIYTRTDDGKRSDFRFRVKSVNMIKANIATQIKSTTCPAVSTKTTCKLKVQFPAIFYELSPVDSKSKVSAHSDVLDLSQIPLSFLIKNFPEIYSLFHVELSCDDWGWARRTDHPNQLQILEGGFVTDSQKEDLNISAKSESRFLEPTTCDLRKHGCSMVNRDLSTRPQTTLVLMLPDYTWYLETAPTDEAPCTTEFQPLNSAQLFQSFAGKEWPAGPKRLNTPEFLNLVQEKLSQDLVNKWVDLQLKLAITTRDIFGQSAEVDTMATLIHKDWFKLLNMVDISSSFFDSEKQIHTITLKDTFGHKDN